MANDRKAAKVNIPICMAGVLFCLTLISIYLTSGLYAKYTTVADSTDSARVITFGDISLTESGDFEDDGTLMIIPGVDLTKKAVVDFAGSEAATYVFIEVILSSEWQPMDSADPKTFFVGSVGRELMQWTIEDNWQYLLTESLETDKSTRYIYYCQLEPNTQLQAADIIADIDKEDSDKEYNIHVSDQITKSEISAMAGTSIKFRATAVQSNGFENPTAAWESIAAK